MVSSLLCLWNRKILMNTVHHYNLKRFCLLFFSSAWNETQASPKLVKALAHSGNQPKECLQRTTLCL